MWLQTLPNGTDLNDVLLWYDGIANADRKRKTAYTLTDITFGNRIHGGREIVLNGSTSHIMCDSQLVGAGDVTFCGWIYPEGWGGSDTGIIYDNGKVFISISDTADNILVSSDFVSTVGSANSSISLNTWYFLAITRESDGTANIYLNGALSGTADQDSGTPANGTASLTIGDYSGDGDYSWDGKMTNMIIFNKILTVDQIRQMYNKHK